MKATQQAEQTPDPQPAKRRLKNYLLDPHFQLRWVLRVGVATAIIVSIMGYFLYGTMSDATDQLLAQQLGNPDLTPEAEKAFFSQNEQDKAATLWTLVGGLIGLVLLLSLGTIVVTHKIAGPIYKMRRLFGTIDGDHLQLWAKLRKGDELQDAFSDFEAMLLRLRKHRHRDLEELAEARRLMAEEKNPDEAIELLDGLAERYKDSVKMN